MENSATDPVSKDTSYKSAPFGLWLSWQELNGRKVIFFINVILIALLIALPVSLDLIGKARKSSVGTRVDYIGPSLMLVPKGILSSDLVTAKLKGKTFSYSNLEVLQRELSRFIRNAEARLTTRLPVKNKNMPVTGMDFQNVYSYPFTKYPVSENEILLGTVAAEKLQIRKNDTLNIHSRTFTVAGIIPTSGGIEDVSLFISLPVLQELAGLDGRINEIRLFPKSAASYDELKLYLNKYTGKLNIIDAYRGETAEKTIDTTLFNYQKALYTVAFILIALCIMISTYINLDGRKAEVSTVYTLGATQGIIFQILTLRTVWITLLGSLIGQFIALSVIAIKDYGVPLRLILSGRSFFEVVLGTVFLGVLVTIPFAIYSVYKRNLIAHL
jgi:ABC-type antimicrobial peptide transport system permease subunit